MNKKILLLVIVLAIFVAGMLCAFAVEPVDAKTYKGKKKITIKVKKGKKTYKIKTKYNKKLKQYTGKKKINGKKYSSYISYEKKNGMQNGKKGWWTYVGGEKIKSTLKHSKKRPVTTVKI